MPIFLPGDDEVEIEKERELRVKICEEIEKLLSPENLSCDRYLNALVEGNSNFSIWKKKLKNISLFLQKKKNRCSYFINCKLWGNSKIWCIYWYN